MRAFVLDCSMTMAWCFKDEANARTNAIRRSLAEDSYAITPRIWLLEIANVLLVAERRGRLTKSDASTFTSFLKDLPIEIDSEYDEWNLDGLMTLAREHHLSSYDAVYLELARRKKIPLATLDSDLAQAARILNLELI
jgi:predicted nucleic acid-binding protein